MYRQTYESPVFEYLTEYPYCREADGSTPAGNIYNQDLVTPPRIYPEELSGVKGFWANAGDIQVLAFMDQVWWPSWNVTLWSPNNGRYFSWPTSAVFWALTRLVCVSYQGTFWRSDSSGDIQPLSIDLTTVPCEPEKPARRAVITVGDTIDASFFGRSAINLPLVDSVNGIIAMKSGATNSIDVCSMATGATLRTIRLSGNPIAMCPADEYEAYILCSNNVLNVVRLDTGRILGTSLMPRVSGSTGIWIAWNARYRRLLALEITPNEANGASTLRVRGYYPVPIATNLTQPVPLIAPRAHRETPLAVRLVGDVGEPLATAVVHGELSATAPAAATLTQQSATADPYGYAELEMLGTAPGEIEVTATADV